jgi:NAD(P)-dependent dehydrogenase (short-subunit alcohol dehydrogenase family)
MSEFVGQVVMVTGASGGLGPAVVDAFLAAGATVVGVSRSIRRHEDEHFISVAADLGTAEGVKAAVNEALKKTQGLDALVHVMGGFAGGKPVQDTDDATWESMIGANLRSAFLITRAVLPHMIKAGYGRIVAVGSRVGEEPASGLSAYGVSKAGLHALVRTIARETLDQGITANVVMPSTIDTPANRKAMPGADFRKWVRPEKIAEQIVWLCSDAASETSGALLPIYGKT